MKKIQNSYKKSGVNISVANKLIKHIASVSKKNVKKTDKSIFAENIGAFGSIFDISNIKIKDPVIVSCTDGVGTKVDLRFDPDTLRIEELEEGDEDAMTMTTSSLVDQLKRSNSIKAEEPEAQDVISGAMNMREFFKKNDQ